MGFKVFLYLGQKLKTDLDNCTEVTWLQL